jgi:azurin
MNNAAISYNGMDWISSNSLFPEGKAGAVTWNGIWIAVGEDGTGVYTLSTSTNGLDWVAQEVFPANIQGECVASQTVLPFATDSGLVPGQRILYEGNTLTVDAVNGNDVTASRGRTSFRTIEAANAAAQSGDTIWVLPGTYNLTAGITLTDGVSLTGISTQTVIIQMLNVTANTSLITMGENTRLENVTMKLTSADHYTLTGLTFPGTTATTAKLRTSVLTVDNSGASVDGTSTVTGILFSGTGGAGSFSFNALKASTVNVYSNGQGNKRGILVNNSTTASTRDMNIYVAQAATISSTGSYVGVETADANNEGSIQLRATTVGVTFASGQAYTCSDILQTNPTTITNPSYLSSPGIQIGPGTDLVTKSAGGKGFSTYIYPTTIYYGLRGDLKNGTSGGYLWPGTMIAAGGGHGFPDTGTPQAYYRVQQPALISGLACGVSGVPGTGNTLTVLVRVTPVGGSITSTVFTVTFGAADTDKTFYDASYRVNTGDKIHIQVSYTGGNDNAAHDLTVQVDMF